MLYEEMIDKQRIPTHVAIIMDGNGRWAESHGLERPEGHAAGVKTVRRIVEDAVRLGIRYLTLYTFSTENWKRPDKEIKILMNLLLQNIEEEIFMKNNVRFRVIGDMERIPALVRGRIKACIKATENNTRSDLIIALSYSSRWEITRAARLIAEDVRSGLIKAEDISEELISSRLETSFMPDPDLMIRTGGEMRLSNYMMWQASYSELYFTDVFWPDFDREELCKAIYSYQQRERRYGMTSAQVTESK
ncbi:MAG: isoprenyl transferase [Bacteroidaceae bacterium]|nr:isoprenyl transferase [Bacteroidaceae bacterium]